MGGDPQATSDHLVNGAGQSRDVHDGDGDGGDDVVLPLRLTWVEEKLQAQP